MSQVDLIVSRASDLPTLPQVASKILERVRNPNSTAADLGSLISRDQALVTKLLRMANSALYGMREPVTDVRRAIVVIGFTTLRSVVMAAATQSMFQSSRSRLKDYLLWEHSLATAVGARLVAGELRYPAPEEAFVAGLLHDVGKVVLDKSLSRRYQEVVEAVFNEGKSFVEAETEILGFDHTEIGGRVAEKWNLAAQLQEAVRLHHNLAEAEIDPTLCAIVALANNMARNFRSDREQMAELAEAGLDAAERLGIESDRIDGIRERMLARLEEERALFQ